MPDEHDAAPETPSPSPVERLIARSREMEDGYGRRLSERATQRQRSLEGYLQAGNRPRWMERIAEIDHGIARVRQRLARDHLALQEECGEDRMLFAQLWSERVARMRFDELNLLIEQHNEWFPIERRLPVDPRTGDYVRVNGRSYRRPVLGPEWVLEHFPA